jgi:hypothetical protein
MTKRNPEGPMWPSIYAQLEALEMTPARLRRAKLDLQRAEQLVDLLFAAASRLKGLFDAMRRRRGVACPVSPGTSAGTR